MVNFEESTFSIIKIEDFGEMKIRRTKNFGQLKILTKNHPKHKLEILENSLRSPKFYKNGREIITRNNLAFGL